jgi:hypothetical protein
MTYGSNPNGTGIPYGGAGHTNIPLPGANVKVTPVPKVAAKIKVSDSDEDDVYGAEDPEYTEGEQSGGMWQSPVATVAQPGDKAVDLVEGDPAADDIIWGTDDGRSGVGDADIVGTDDFGSGELSDDELDRVMFGDDDEIDKIIEGEDPDEMSNEEFERTVYGEPDKPEITKTKKLVYRVARPRNMAQSRATNTGLGMAQ